MDGATLRAAGQLSCSSTTERSEPKVSVGLMTVGIPLCEFQVPSQRLSRIDSLHLRKSRIAILWPTNTLSIVGRQFAFDIGKCNALQSVANVFAERTPDYDE